MPSLAKMYSCLTMSNARDFAVTSSLPIRMRHTCTFIRTIPYLVQVFISSGTPLICPAVRRKHCPLSKAKSSVQITPTSYFQISTASPWYWHRVRSRAIKPSLCRRDNMHFGIFQSVTVYGSISLTTTWTNPKQSSCIYRELRTT